MRLSNLIYKTSLCFIIVFMSLFISCRGIAEINSLVPIVKTPNPMIVTDVGVPFTLHYIIIDDNPANYSLTRNGDLLELKPISTNILYFTRNEPKGEYIFALEVTDFSNNRGVANISVSVQGSEVIEPSASDFLDKRMGESHFAVEIDLAVSEPSSPDLISDLIIPSEETNDSNEHEDIQLFLTYMNKSGIEVVYSALEKMEHNITFGELLATNIENTLKSTTGNEIKTALNTTMFHINVTTPFQQLVQHFTTPWAFDVFVTNNFMGLIAYSADPNDQNLDAGDELYIGYTFSVQELIDAVNDGLVKNNHSNDQIGHFEYEINFEQTLEGYKFGIEYTNMFVVWQDAKVPLQGVDIFNAGSQFIRGNTDGIVYGQGIAAASVFDKIGFEYEFTTQGITGPFSYNLGTVTTQYNIGECIFLATKDNQTFIDNHSDNWTMNPFIETPSYTIETPDTLKNYTIPLTNLTIPNFVTINLSQLAFYFDDDAKVRISMEDGFGLTVATATTTFGVSVEDPEFAVSDKKFDLMMDGNTYFFTDFVGKDTYNLLGLEDLYSNIDPTEDRPVHIIPFNHAGYTINDVLKEYLTVEFGLAYEFTKFITQRISTPYFIFPAGTAQFYVETIIYFTFTEFSEWYGGEIVHDPAYSAVGAMAGNGGETSSTETPPPTSTFDSMPGFELLSVLCGIIFVTIVIIRKRRGRKR